MRFIWKRSKESMCKTKNVKRNIFITLGGRLSYNCTEYSCWPNCNKFVLVRWCISHVLMYIWVKTIFESFIEVVYDHDNIIICIDVYIVTVLAYFQKNRRKSYILERNCENPHKRRINFYYSVLARQICRYSR